MPKKLLKKHIENVIKQKGNAGSEGTLPLEGASILGAAGYLSRIVGSLVGLGGHAFDRLVTKAGRPVDKPAGRYVKQLAGKVSKKPIVADYDVMRNIARRVMESGIDVNLNTLVPQVSEYRGPIYRPYRNVSPGQLIHFPPHLANPHLLAKQLGEADVMRSLPLLSRAARSPNLQLAAVAAPALAGIAAATDYVFSKDKDRAKRAINVARIGATLGAAAASPAVLEEGLSLGKGVKNLYQAGMRPSRILGKSIPTLAMSVRKLAPILGPIIGTYLGAELLEDKLEAGKLKPIKKDYKEQTKAIGLMGGTAGSIIGGGLGARLATKLTNSPTIATKFLGGFLGAIVGAGGGDVLSKYVFNKAVKAQQNKKKKKK